MGLSEGFVPIGLKEHGGIMYIASVNKEGVGEIGTIPSPILTLSLKNVEFEDENIMLVENSGPIQNIIPITEFKVYPGEKFLPLLFINTDLNIGGFRVETTSGSKNLYDNRNIVSTAGKHDGLYQLKLYSIYASFNCCFFNCFSNGWSNVFVKWCRNNIICTKFIIFNKRSYCFCSCNLHFFINIGCSAI